MDAILFLARILLAALFGFAGIAKLLDLKGSKKAMEDFGVPEWLAGPTGYCLPIVEILVACLLIPARTASWGALGSVVLLTVFVIGIAVNMARGKRPDCHCFGQLHSEPIGISTLLRNVFLAAVAGGLLWMAPNQPGLSLSAAMNMIFAGHTIISAFGVGLVLALAAQAYLTFHLFRQNGRLLLRIEALESAHGPVLQPAASQRAGLPIGSPAPRFELSLARGRTGSLDRLLELGKPVLLLFSDAACGPCKALMPELVGWQRQHAEKLTFALVTRGVSKEKSSGLPDLEHIFIQEDREVAAKYLAFGTPSAILVGKDGLVGSSIAAGAPAIGSLVSAAASGSLPMVPAVRPAPQPARNVLPLGSPAPKVTLPDLSGKSVSLSEFLGHEVLLLFWNPSCGFCSRMLPRLKEFESSRSKNSLRTLLISTGTPEQNRAMGLRSPVLLDQSQGALALFGASGTPSGMLVDLSGNIGSGLVVGADAIMALVETRKAVVVDRAALTLDLVEQQPS